MKLTPAQALFASRVELLDLIHEGLPAREYVPGAHGILVKGKHHHIAAPKKTGKSIVFGVVMPVQIVAAGGRVVVLDRENGADEYARRLDKVLEARGTDEAFKQNLRGGFSYHAWPQVRLGWDPEAYAGAFLDADLVIFDSARKFLTAVGRKEDSSDDFSDITEAFIDPLNRAGIATGFLDNFGHENARARGTSAKGDLADVNYLLEREDPFDIERAGRVELVCQDSRLGEIPAGRRWDMRIGGGIYGQWTRPGAQPPPAARSDLHDAVVELLREEGPMGKNRIEGALHKQPEAPKFANEALREALEEWAANPASPVEKAPGGRGFQAMPWGPRHGGHAGEAAAWDGMDEPEGPANPRPVGDSAMPWGPRHESERPPCRHAPPPKGGMAGHGRAAWAATANPERPRSTPRTSRAN